MTQAAQTQTNLDWTDILHYSTDGSQLLDYTYVNLPITIEPKADQLLYKVNLPARNIRIEIKVFKKTGYRIKVYVKNTITSPMVQLFNYTSKFPSIAEAKDYALNLVHEYLSLLNYSNNKISHELGRSSSQSNSLINP